MCSIEVVVLWIVMIIHASMFEAVLAVSSLLLLTEKCFLVCVCACAAIDELYRRVSPKQNVYKSVVN